MESSLNVMSRRCKVYSMCYEGSLVVDFYFVPLNEKQTMALFDTLTKLEIKVILS